MDWWCKPPRNPPFPLPPQLLCLSCRQSCSVLSLVTSSLCGLSCRLGRVCPRSPSGRAPMRAHQSSSQSVREEQCDLRVRWKVASDLRFRAAISEPKTPSFCGISGDLAPSTRKSLVIAIVRFWCAKTSTIVATSKHIQNEFLTEHLCMSMQLVIPKSFSATAEWQNWGSSGENHNQETKCTVIWTGFKETCMHPRWRF